MDTQFNVRICRNQDGVTWDVIVYPEWEFASPKERLKEVGIKDCEDALEKAVHFIRIYLRARHLGP